LDIDSIPPATTTSMSPSLTDCAANATARRPEPHTMLTVKAETSTGSPALSAACRAGACPTPACTTQPMMTSSTSARSTPARLTASLIAMAPNSGAVNPFKAP
jgi:hypothetical protein